MNNIYEKNSTAERVELVQQSVSDDSAYFFSKTKRTVDVMVSLLGLVVLFIPFVLVAVLIKLEDPKGPIFFSQTRVGAKGQPFILYKFRTMSVDAEERLNELMDKNEIQGYMFKMKYDPRITRTGRFLRKFSIDEFPQLFNVLKGDMSLVGPRPALPCEVEKYSNYHRLRLRIKPGCTGLWQVSGRNKLHFEEMIRLDLAYINKGDLFFDLKIIAKTLWVILTHDGAY
ncbi:sugar transferase [Candidatus Enterococcus ferrettii]|uniref:Bacterial sugar transferase domain-containing protein n=1 Tax=Candidatus Enterococcus ferrettii TaxID=2815324 RepID=A0ABV0EIL5_9ENTE|nr:sugar transferase [Enterococcus sp. 665A]MBO1340517.1 sugar transferase [Enterococcus sp. 665A]